MSPTMGMNFGGLGFEVYWLDSVVRILMIARGLMAGLFVVHIYLANPGKMPGSTVEL